MSSLSTQQKRSNQSQTLSNFSSFKKAPLNQKIYSILLLLVIVVQPPFMTFSLIPNYKIIGGIILCLLIIIILTQGKLVLVHRKNFIYLMSYILINIIYYVILAFEPLNLKYSVSLTIGLASFSICFLTLINVCTKINFLELYVKFISMLAAINTIGYLLVFLKLLKPLGTFLSKLNENDEFYNYGLFFVQKKLVTEIGDSSLMRTCGYFDEPGTFAFYIMLSLIAYQIFFSQKIKNKILEINLLIAGITTFSLAFYIFLVLYLLFFYSGYFVIKAIKFLTKNKIQIFYTLLMISLGFFLYLILTNEILFLYLKEKIFERLELTGDEQVFSGNNRARSFNIGLPLFLDNIWLGWGIGYVKAYFKGFDGSSIMGALVSYGLLGCIIIYWIFVWVTFKLLWTLKIKFVGVGLIFLLNFIQRPWNFNDPLNILYLFYLISYYSFSSKKQKNSIEPELLSRK
jgi:hypothetical protein